jgi:hypothetical protein
VVEVIGKRRWKEIALRWRERDVLVVAEAVGTAPLFALGRGAVGVHPVLRLTPPRVLEGIDPKVLLVGHGALVETDAAASLRTALARSRSDIPRLLLSLPGAVRGRLWKTRIAATSKGITREMSDETGLPGPPPVG